MKEKVLIRTPRSFSNQELDYVMTLSKQQGVRSSSMFLCEVSSEIIRREKQKHHSDYLFC